MLVRRSTVTAPAKADQMPEPDAQLTNFHNLPEYARTPGLRARARLVPVRLDLSQRQPLSRAVFYALSR